MKYYCKHCGMEFRFPQEYATDDDYCLACGNDDPDYILTPIPDYETPEQYEKRTGKAYPDDGLVWYRIWDDGRFLLWDYAYFSVAKEATDDGIDQILIADPPVPPSDDWRPE